MARLAFFGTPDFSTASLKAVYRFCREQGHELSLVVTQPDRPQGRGKETQSPPVKQLALSLGLEVMQPESLRKNTPEGEAFYQDFCKRSIDLAVIVAYGKIIPERLIQAPKRGFVNVHGSLLPKYRGAAPVQRAIEAGDRISGVCLMDVVKKLDEGDVYACATTPILACDTSETLMHRLAHLGAHLLYQHMDGLLLGTLSKKAQGDEGATYAHMLTKEEGSLNFSQLASVISRKTRAFDPWPGAYVFIHKKRIKLFDSFYIERPVNHPPGSVVVAGRFLGIAACDGVVYFEAMQIEGKKVQTIKEALFGFAIAVGDRLLVS